jgi:predicted nucleotidyltransferase
MDERIVAIVNDLKQEISRKYVLIAMRVFGSTARGDRSAESDIDVLLHLPRVNRQIEEDLFDIAYGIELKYDCLTDLIILSDENLANMQDQPLIYRNMIKEGVAI